MTAGRRGGGGAIAVISVVLVAALTAAIPAMGSSSRIVWTRIALNSPLAGIVSALPDGDQPRKLTDPKKHRFDVDAQVSPDGDQVIVERDSNNGKAQTILVDADGSNEHVLDLGCVDACALDSAPTWFGTSGRIAYTRVVGPFDGPGDSARAAALQTSLLDGADPLRLSEPGIDGQFEDYHAHLSPDGSYVVFTRVRNEPLAVAAFRMNVDGSDVRRLTPWGIGGDLADLSPATSGPTEDLITFETYGMGAPKGKNQNVATVPATCGSVSDCRKKTRYLTPYGAGRVAGFNPSWSPSGRRIAYTLFKGPDDDHECCVGDIWTMRPDGSDRKPVSQSPAFEYRPDWGPGPSKGEGR